MFFNDPEEFEDFLKPVASNISIRPAIGKLFNAEICMKKFQSVGLFSVSANSFRAIKEPQNDFFGLTIPLSTPFTITKSGSNQLYKSNMAHMLSPGQPFNISAKRQCHFLVSNFFIDPINDYSKKLLQSDSQLITSISSDISLITQPGGLLLASVARAWSAVNNEKFVSEIALKELEDDLMASLVLYSNQDKESKYYNQDCLYRLSRAEEYIRENLKSTITRDQLAEISSCSIRSLSRAFEKKYGGGPKAFIKMCRLNSVYLELLSSEYDMTTVTQVALEYGFGHTGKFAIEFKNIFGESPSTSLKRN